MADPLIGGALSLDSTLQWASLKLDSTLNLIPCNLQTPNAQVPISYAPQNPELLHSKLYPGPSPCRPQAQAVVSSDVAFSIYGFGFPFRPKRYLQAFTCGTSSSRQTSQKGCICWIQQPPPPPEAPPCCGENSMDRVWRVQTAPRAGAWKLCFSRSQLYA